MTTLDYNTTPVRGMQAGRIPLSFQLRNLLAVRGPVIPPDQRAIVTDLSFWEGGVDFDRMQQAGARATYVKCTQGTAIFDSKYTQFTTDCDNLPLGDYHYLTSANSQAQADWYMAHTRSNKINFRRVVDVEVDGLDSALIRNFVIAVKNGLALPEYPDIYTSAYKWSLVKEGHKPWLAANCRLIVAHYGVDAPLMPTGWTDYLMHQYTDSGDGHLYGCASAEVDLNRARKSLFPANTWAKDLTAWARTQPNPYAGPDPE